MLGTTTELERTALELDDEATTIGEVAMLDPTTELWNKGARPLDDGTGPKELKLDEDETTPRQVPKAD